mgnify:FL=1|tara:strand:+ start:100 stop:477 length:378 start_codon:yes stop_codon:yes gene_type:complete
MANLAMLLFMLLLGACKLTVPFNGLSSTAPSADANSVVTVSQNQEEPIIPPCTDKEVMVKKLHKHFREQPLIHGTAKGGDIITIFAGAGGRFTLTRTRNDTMCLLMVGDRLNVISHGPVSEKTQI